MSLKILQETAPCADKDGIPKCARCRAPELKFTLADFILDENTWRPKDPEKWVELLPTLLRHLGLTEAEYTHYVQSEGKAFITRLIDPL